MPEAGSAVDEELILLLLPPSPSTSLFSCLCSRCGAVPGCEHCARSCECRCTLCTTGVFVLLSLTSVCLSPSPSPCWGSAPAETSLELPPSSCMERSYCSLSHFSLPLCLYHITLWSLITCADAWDADGPANGARSVNLLWGPVLPSLAVALTLISPRLLSWEARVEQEFLLMSLMFLAQRRALGPPGLVSCCFGDWLLLQGLFLPSL